MTKKERTTPSLINTSRKRRMAKGSGLNEIQINRILKQFKNAAKMAKKLSKGGMKDMQKMMSQMGGNAGMQIPR
jgi:signal recognition particle subunit SRP54